MNTKDVIAEHSTYIQAAKLKEDKFVRKARECRE